MHASDGMMMRFARTMLAVVVALSVAMLPTAGPTAVGAKPAGMAMPADMTMSDDMAMSDDMSGAMDDCCPDHAKSCDHGGDPCQSMACCVHQIFGMSSVAIAPFTFALLPGKLLPTLTEQVVPSHAGSPPFRPPRV